MKLVHLDRSTRLAAQVEALAEQARAGDELIVHTSGTTGTPKVIRRDLGEALAKKRGGAPDHRFLLTYSPERWSGISVVLHCLAFDCTLIIPRSLEATDLLAAAIAERPSHISLTPSMLRTIFISDPDRAWSQVPLRQITFGGEAASQSVIDLAQAYWPTARISHTYASTEHGDILAVSDGLAGIPARKLDRHSFEGDLEVGAELIIDGISTGDLWRRAGDRYHFVGRREEIINVGGNKVSPLVVEEAAIAAGATMARAYAVRSPLVGSMVGLEYTGEIEPRALQAQLRARLPKYAWPVNVDRVQQLALSAAGKTKRVS